MRSTLTILALLAATGCGGAYQCNERGPCANGGVPTQAEIDACNKVVGATDCGAAARDLLTCLNHSAVCTSSGDLDGAATLAKCQTEKAKLSTCCQTHSDSDACT